VKIHTNAILTVIAALSAVLYWPGSLQGKEWLLEPEGERELTPAKVSPDRQKLDQAQQTLIKGQPAKAYKMFGAWLKKFRDSPLRPEAIYYAGQSLEQQGRLNQAFETYEQLVEPYAESEYFRLALEAEFGIAGKFLSGTKRQALGIFKVSADDVGIHILERLPERWPRSLLAERALMLLGDYYLQKLHYAEAADTYNKLITNYPSSAFIRQARLAAAKAYMAMFKGLAFDPAPLIEARERLLEYQELYRGNEHASEVQAMLQKIDTIQAERDYQVGRFYQRTGKNSSARFYYQQVVQRWPKSKWSTKAKDRLNKLGPANTTLRSSASTLRSSVTATAEDGSLRSTKES